MALEFYLSPSQSAFVNEAEAHICLFIGPMGEGKTHAGAVALIAHAKRCLDAIPPKERAGKIIRAALVRDTHQNIKTSTAPSLREILGKNISFHDDEKKAFIYGAKRRKLVELDLFGIDDQASLQKLQGPEYAVIWLEEPAPIIDKANAGLSKDVFDMALARAARQSGTRMRVQITQNPADEDHWTAKLALAPEIYFDDEESGQKIIKKVFRAKSNENKFLNEIARAANKAAFQHDEGKYLRYVRGEEAPVMKGKKVCPGYSKDLHFAGVELPVVPGAIGIRGWDGWHHPVCIIGQWVPPGRLIIHDGFRGDGIGVREVITEKLLPLLNTPKYKGKISDWRDIGDPSMDTPDQSSVTQAASKVIRDLLRSRFERGPMKWQHRIDPLNTALAKLVGGRPAIEISSTAYEVHRALNGGWHWKTDNSGNRVGNVPVKDQYADWGDGLSYPAAVLFPYRRETSKDKRPPARPKMAMSYAAHAR